MTDSTSDLEPLDAEALGIDVVPLFVNFGDQRFRDGVELSRAEFYRRMREGKALPTTSQPTAAMFEEVYRPHVEAGRAIVSIHITERLSGTINAARAAAAQFPSVTVRLVDSLTVSAGCALLVRRAAEMAREDADSASIVAEIERARAVQHGYCTLPDLSHAVRTGRIGKTQAALGGLLKIVPVLKIGGGEVEAVARVRTFARAKETVVELIAGALGEVARARVIVMHAHVPEAGRALLVQLRARLGVEPAYLALGEAGPAIATHAGEGAVGIFAIAG